jgi:hypothetical protein
MARMPNFEAEIARDLARASSGVEHVLGHLHHHHAAQAATPTPAAGPVTVKAAPNLEERIMSLLDTITGDVRADLTDGLDYAEGLLGRLKAVAPSVIETADKLGGTTVGKLVDAAAGMVLPAPYEDVAVSFIKDLVSKYGQQPLAAPAAPVVATPDATPAAPAVQPVQ